MSQLVRALGVGRIAFGAATLLKPEAVVRGWIGQRAARLDGTQLIAQTFGIRDMALGAGTLAALMAGKDAKDWVLAAAVCDCVDLAATLTTDDVPAAGRILVGALASSAIGVSAAYLMAGSRD